jgi:hypothetical protein
MDVDNTVPISVFFASSLPLRLCVNAALAGITEQPGDGTSRKTERISEVRQYAEPLSLIGGDREDTIAN